MSREKAGDYERWRSEPLRRRPEGTAAEGRGIEANGITASIGREAGIHYVTGISVIEGVTASCHGVMEAGVTASCHGIIFFSVSVHLHVLLHSSHK